MSDWEPLISFEEQEAGPPLTPFETEDSYKLPEFVNDYGFWDAVLVGTGRRMTQAKRSIQKLLSSEEGKKKLQDLMTEEDRLYFNGIANQASPVKGGTSLGELGGDVAMSALLPMGWAKSILGRMAQAGLMGAGYEAATNPEDRLQHGMLGVVGGAVGSGVVDTAGKAGSAAFRNYGKNSTSIAVRDKLRKMGLKPMIGDLVPPNKSTWFRGLENTYIETPPGKQVLLDEAMKIEKILVPDRVTKKNVLTDAVRGTDKGVSDLSNDIWTPFERAISNNVTSVRPRGLWDGLQELYERYPQVFSQSNIPDAKLRERLLNIAQAPDPKKLASIPIGEYHKLRKSMGSALAKVRQSATPAAAGGPAPLDKEAVSLFGKLYHEDMLGDISRWGTNGRNQKAFAQFEQANKRWVDEVLPWKENPIAADLKAIQKAGVPKTAATVALEPDTVLKDEVRRYLKEYGPYDATNVFDAVNHQARAANLLANPGAGSTRAPESFWHAAISPLTYPIAYAGGAASNKVPVQNMYFADPSWVRPFTAADDSTLGQAVKGSLSQIGTIKNALANSANTVSREMSEEELATMAAIKDLFDWIGVSRDDDTAAEQLNNVGHSNQLGQTNR